MLYLPINTQGYYPCCRTTLPQLEILLSCRDRPAHKEYIYQETCLWYAVGRRDLLPDLFLSMLTISLLLVVLPFSTTDAAFYYPDVQTSLLEHILVDNWGAYASNFSSAITPCTRYVTQTGTAALNSGRTTAAQWMRVLFHDFITANVSAGTGGIDASIGFETARAENSGSAFNDSFTFWKAYVNSAVSSMH